MGSWLEAKNVEVVRWDDSGQFPLGGYTLPRLLEISQNVDGAVLLFTPDDKVNSRNKRGMQPRDNVLIEYGIFSGRLGQHGAVICARDRLKTASDLFGLNTVDLGRENNAQLELAQWLESLPNHRTSKKQSQFAFRIAVHCSQTKEIGQDEVLGCALKSFYKTFLQELFRRRIGINTCGAVPFRDVVCDFYCEEFLKSGHGQQYVDEYSDWIKWYWYSESQAFTNGPPPVFEANHVAGSIERTWAEADDADLIVAVCGKTGTIQQLERVLGGKEHSVSNDKKPIIVLGWFGGPLQKLAQHRQPSSREKRFIRSSEDLDFTSYFADWPNRTSELAVELASAIVRLLPSRRNTVRMRR